MLTAPNRRGFTLVEVVVALTILSVSVLGLASAASRLTVTAATAEVRALALEAVESRIARVRLDPRYGDLDSLYTAVETDVLGASLPQYVRTTTVTRVVQQSPTALDYTRVLVEVTGPLLGAPVARRLIVAAP